MLVPFLVVVVWNVYNAAQLALARQHEATHDSLTDLANRRKFFDEVRHARNRAQRERYSFAIAILDLDGFKKVNDQLGHRVGDRVLEEVAARLRRSCRSVDVAGGSAVTSSRCCSAASTTSPRRVRRCGRSSASSTAR